MSNKNIIADKAYTYLKDGVKILLVLIPGIPSEAKLIDPVLDLIFKNLQWNGILSDDLTVQQKKALRNAIENTINSVSESTSKNKRELINRARPELESLLQGLTMEQLASDEINKSINKTFSRPSNLDAEFLTDRDFNEFTKLFLKTLEKNIDNTPLADTLNRKKISAVCSHIEILDKQMKDLDKQMKDVNKQMKDLDYSMTKLKDDFIMQKEICKDNTDIFSLEDLQKLIEDEQEEIMNLLLFPWFRRTIGYRKALEKVFIHPNFKMLKENREFMYDDLINLHSKNIVVLGEAGAGKTTLLRYLFCCSKIQNYVKTIYIEAKSLKGNSTSNKLKRYVYDVIDKGCHNEHQLLILIDGIDEAYFNDIENYNKLIEKISSIEKCHVWLGCRLDYFSYVDKSKYDFIFYDLLKIQPWEDRQANKFIKEYSLVAKCSYIPDRIDELIRHNSKVKEFKKNPFQLTLLTYIIQFNKNLNLQVDSLFDLYEKFIDMWIYKEKDRETSYLEKDRIVSELYNAAKKIYNGQKYEIIERDSAIIGLLNINVKNPFNEKEYAISFYHHSLSAFFLAKRIIEAMIEGGVNLVRALSHKLMNDIKDFIWDGIDSLDDESKRLVVINMENIYRHIINKSSDSLCKTTQQVIDKLDDTESFILRDEIVFLISKLGINCSDFIKFAYKNEIHPIIKMGIAYSALVTGPDDIALDFAKMLTPGTEEELTNRSWTLVYFGDINENPYIYKDTEKRPWLKARQKRINKLSKDDLGRKNYRLRLFDIPLIYCFLVDRGWNDITLEELTIIENCSITDVYFNSEEKIFLENSKAQLVNEYKKQLSKLTDKTR